MNSIHYQAVQGLQENWKQFSLLVVINALVGSMIGLERSIFPEYASTIFGIESNSAFLTFIIVFGISKAISNYYAGKYANRLGRKNLLVLGWIIVLPVPLILAFTDSWLIVLLANLLLGVSQGLTWSSTVIMKIDLVGPKNRGLAMGLNEFAGYLAIGITAYFTANLASNFGVRPIPFLIGFGIALLGLYLSFFFLKDTTRFIRVEKFDSKKEEKNNIFWNTTFRSPNLSSITQAGLVNNLNDGMIWGLLPLLLIQKEFSLNEIGKLIAIYPLVWGMGQLFSGKIADIISKKFLIVFGMIIQGFAIIILAYSNSFSQFSFISIVLGIGTAIVYPTFLAAISDETHPEVRAESVGVFRLWRDLGYAFGAILSGWIADNFGLELAIASVGMLTIASGIITQLRMTREAFFRKIEINN